MKCPKCPNKNLEQTLTNLDITVDRCQECKGIWFDKGELNHFIKDKNIKKEIDQIENQKETTHCCPRCQNTKLTKGNFKWASDTEVDYCPTCEGFFLDKGELKTLIGVKSSDALEAKVDKGKVKKYLNPEAKVSKLPRLPSLIFRSIIVLGSLYAILFALLLYLSSVGIISENFVGSIMIGAIVLNFLLAPITTDIDLTLFGSLSWVGIDTLPEKTKKFLIELCEKEKIKVPRIGYIPDNAPNAFTYGRTPYDARLVLTEGIFKLLDEDEQIAVVAHEVGHIVHWDFAFMTMAQTVPLIIYRMYKFLSKILKEGGRSRRSGRGDNLGTKLQAIAICVFLLYKISEFITLFLSRVREYWADRYSAKVTNNPNALSMALVKIAYGLSCGNQKGPNADEIPGGVGEGPSGVLGISNVGVSRVYGLGMAQRNYNNKNTPEDDIKEVMRWDLWNPWAKAYELASTHPLVAKRINALGVCSQYLGQSPILTFDLKKPENYYGGFIKEVFLYVIPLLFLLIPGSLWFLSKSLEFIIIEPEMLRPLTGFCVMVSGLTYFLKTKYSYPNDHFAEYSIAALLKKVKVSEVKGIPVTLRGKILGRGVPGYVFSEDMVLMDKTGIIFLDYHQLTSLFNFFFAIRKVQEYMDTDVVISGWYRRSPMPYIEIYDLSSSRNYDMCRTRGFKMILAFLGIIGGTWYLFHHLYHMYIMN